MMKLSTACSIWLLLFLFAVAMYGQTGYSNLSATITDTSGTAWANGTWQIDFQPAPNAAGPYYLNGVVMTPQQQHFAGTLSSTGAFSVVIPSNDHINPVGSTWNFTLCSNTSAQCSYVNSLGVTGATPDYSGTFSSSVKVPSIPPVPLARAYNDSEVAVSPTLVGYIYQNVTTNQPRYWNGSTWQNFGGAVNSLTLTGIPNFATTNQVSGAPNYNYGFTLLNAPPNSIWANCTGTMAAPSYCTLTPAMIPSSYVPAQATALSATQGCVTAGQYARSMTTNGTFNCSQVTFAQLGGSIAISQFNGGSGASSTTYWRGDGTWAPLPFGNHGVVATFNGTSCSLVHYGDSDQNCTGSVTWSNTITGTYTTQCNIEVPSPGGTDTTGITQTTFTLVPGSFTTTGFQYNIANIHDGAASNTVGLSCSAIQ